MAAKDCLGAASFDGTIFLPFDVEIFDLVLSDLQKAHVASVMSVHALAPR